MKPILAPYVPMADMLAQTFGQDCEVVLHDLADPQHSVVYTANNTVTGRKIGESFDHLVKQVILSDKLAHDYVANYYFQAENGKLVRSSTLLIHDEKGALEGALCINLDTSRITRQMEYLQTFLPPAPEPVPDEKQAQDTHVSQMVKALVESIIGYPSHKLSREERVEKIRFMDAKGIFLMKGSIELVAERLGVNKVTVYSYLDEARGKRKQV